MKVVAASIAVALALAGSASAATLRTHVVASSVTWLGVPAPDAAAYANADGVSLRRDDGSVGSVAPPTGCGPLLAGGGRLAFGCGARPEDNLQLLTVTSIAGTDPVETTMDLYGGPSNDGEVHVTAVGDQWVRADFNAYHCFCSVFRNWRTGETRQSSTDNDVHQALDLSSPTLHRRMCRPLARTPTNSGDLDPLLGAVYDPPWALLDRPDDRHELHRCGRAAASRLLPRARGVTAALGDGWLAWTRGTDVVTLVRLRDGRAFRVRAKLSAVSKLALTRGTLYVVDPYAIRGTFTGVVSAVSLPGR